MISITEKIRTPHIFGSAIILVGVVLLYDQSDPISFKVLYLSLLAAAVLSGLKHVKHHRIYLLIGVSVIISSAASIYNSMPILYSVSLLIFGLVALYLYYISVRRLS